MLNSKPSEWRGRCWGASNTYCSWAGLTWHLGLWGLCEMVVEGERTREQTLRDFEKSDMRENVKWHCHQLATQTHYYWLTITDSLPLTIHHLNLFKSLLWNIMLVLSSGILIIDLQFLPIWCLYVWKPVATWWTSINRTIVNGSDTWESSLTLLFIWLKF